MSATDTTADQRDGYLRATGQALRALNLARIEASALGDRLGGPLEWTKRDGFKAINAVALGIDLAS